MNDELLLSVFVAVEGAHAFSAFMPSYFTVRKFSKSDEDIANIRSGYKPAIVFNLTLGAVVSAMARSIGPLVMSISVILFMVYLYEQAIGDRENAGEIQGQSISR